MDLHAAQIQGFFDVPVDNLYAAPVFALDIRANFRNLDEITVVSPDVGGVARARELAERINADLAIVDKRRGGAGRDRLDDGDRRGPGPGLHHRRRHRRHRRHAGEGGRAPEEPRRQGGPRLHHPRRALGSGGRAHPRLVDEEPRRSPTRSSRPRRRARRRTSASSRSPRSSARRSSTSPTAPASRRCSTPARSSRSTRPSTRPPPPERGPRTLPGAAHLLSAAMPCARVAPLRRRSVARGEAPVRVDAAWPAEVGRERPAAG